MTDDMTLIPIHDPDLRVRLLARANEMTEGPYHLNAAWVRQRGWIAVPVESAGHFDELDAGRLADAMQAAGYRECYAVAAEPVGPPPPPECAVVQATSDGLAGFSHECAPFNYLLMPDDPSYAVLCTVEDYFLVAGPRDFVQRAVGGDIEQARNDFKEFATGWSEQGRLLEVARKYEVLETRDA